MTIGATMFLNRFATGFELPTASHVLERLASEGLDMSTATVAGPIAEAVASGELPGRVWLYSNYHCNLACSYCLTESSPRSPRRQLDASTMVEVARQAADLGFTALGVTGGEPFLLPWLPGDHRRDVRNPADRRADQRHPVRRRPHRARRRAGPPWHRRADLARLPPPRRQRHGPWPRQLRQGRRRRPPPRRPRCAGAHRHDDGGTARRPPPRPA